LPTDKVGKRNRGGAATRRLHGDLATVRREARCACENIELRMFRVVCGGSAFNIAHIKKHSAEY
jgi:hypothetical protein